MARQTLLLAAILTWASVQGFSPIAPSALTTTTRKDDALTILFGKKAARKNKGGGKKGGGGGKARGQQPRQEKQSVQDQRFDAYGNTYGKVMCPILFQLGTKFYDVRSCCTRDREAGALLHE